MLPSSLCIRCFKHGHHHTKCIAFQVVSCSRCFKLHRLTKRCCELPHMAQHKYTQELRLSNPLNNVPRIYLDVKILGRPFAAVLNTFSRRTIVDLAVKVFISRRDPDSIRNHVSPYPEPCIPVPIEFHMVHSIHSALVCDMGDDECLIEIGMDFLMDRGITMNLGGITLDTRQSWITSHQDQIEFAYNHPNGKPLRTALQEIDYPMTQDFRRLTIDQDDFVVEGSLVEHTRDCEKFGD